MGKKKQMSLPRTGGAGIVSYYDDIKGKVEFQPEHVVAFITAFAIVVILFKIFY